jgi:hypothetical protein
MKQNGEFACDLAYGQLGESIIARWVLARGNSVLPVYEKEIDSGKGPRLFCTDGTLVVPDMLVLPALKFVEAKHKTVFSWHRTSSDWCTGIDQRHFSQYQRVEQLTGLQVWLLFLHQSDKPHPRDIAAGCPERCPVGLFGNSLRYLAAHEHHRSEKWGTSGMVYWSDGDLQLLERLDDLQQLLAEHRP